jgi:hypothetical protein
MLATIAVDAGNTPPPHRESPTPLVRTSIAIGPRHICCTCAAHPEAFMVLLSVARALAIRMVYSAQHHGVLALLVISVLLNLYFAREVRRYRQGVSTALGRVVGPLNALSVDGQELAITYHASRPTILYFFSPSCQWCERNWENVRALQAATRTTHRFVGISATKDISSFLTDRRLTFEVVTTPSRGSLLDYHLGGTPQTIVVGTDARILQVWRGAYVGSTAQAVEHYFRTKLPGVAMSAQR